MTEIIYSLCAVICAGLLAFSLTPIVRVLAIKIKAIDIPLDNRRMHHRPVPRIGGLAIFIAFLVATISFCKFDRTLSTILIGGAILVFIGILDDIFRINAFIKLAVQVAVAFFAVSQGVILISIQIFPINSQ